VTFRFSVLTHFSSAKTNTPRSEEPLCRNFSEQIVPSILTGLSFLELVALYIRRDLTAPLVEGEGDSSPSGNYMEGYLTKKGDAGGLFFSEPWSRRYFVLQDRDLYYYKSREDYQFDPQKSIKNRPIDMTGWVPLSHLASLQPAPVATRCQL
jgi:hypothetical protein